jgi:hypothetical protein
MKLTKLEIRRGGENSWEQSDEKPLQGLVELTGPTGKQAIALSPGAISRIVALIAKEVGEQAKQNAEVVTKALNTAADEGYLLESDGAIG